ncbi:MAG: nucleoside triphosphate pyrophosphatase [Akkermansiaceae bacterium]
MDWPLILASGSPRRRDLLREAGLSFQINSPEVEEFGAGDFKPRELCLTNARLKCHEIAKENSDAMVIGADTVVALAGKVYGKPVDLEEAATNLRELRGRVHEVMTGVVLVHGKVISEFVETSYVKFHDFSDEVIEAYLEKVPVLDKAGGYAIQDHGEMLVERYEGCFDNIVGLPVALVLDQLGRMGFPLPSTEK